MKNKVKNVEFDQAQWYKGERFINILYAEFEDGTPLTEKELESLNEDEDLKNDLYNSKIL